MLKQHLACASPADLVLAASSPVRPGDRAGEAGDRREDQAARRRRISLLLNEISPLSSALRLVPDPPFFASRARVAAR